MAGRNGDHDSAVPLSSRGDMEARIRAEVNKWREKLLDLGNRNPLINCSFNSSRGVIRIVHPTCEIVWRKLAADNDAGAASMRFPWRRELFVGCRLRRCSGSLFPFSPPILSDKSASDILAAFLSESPCRIRWLRGQCVLSTYPANPTEGSHAKR